MAKASGARGPATKSRRKGGPQLPPLNPTEMRSVRNVGGGARPPSTSARSSGDRSRAHGSGGGKRRG
jgi:hypothetical protein